MASKFGEDKIKNLYRKAAAGDAAAADAAIASGTEGDQRRPRHTVASLADPGDSLMRRTLLVTNDFPWWHPVVPGEPDRPPRPTRSWCTPPVARLRGVRRLRVFGGPAPHHPHAAHAVRRTSRARLVREHDIHTVWFGAAAPLAIPVARPAQGRRPANHRLHPRARGGLVHAADRPTDPV